MPRLLDRPAGGFRRVAVLRLSSLGDVVLALPVLHALAREFPQARLSFWTKEEYRELVEHDPAIAHLRLLERDARGLDDLVSMSAELEECDLIVDLHGNLRTRVLTFRQRAPVMRAPRYRMRRMALVHARGLKPKPPPGAIERYALALAPLGIAVDPEPRMRTAPAAEEWAAAWLESWSPGAAPIALLPGARHPTKRWPEESWSALFTRLRERGHQVLVLSLESERLALPSLAALVAADAGARWGTEGLARMAALLSRCRSAVSHDSGLMHLAAARGLKLVALFGSTAPQLGFAPAGPGHVVLCRHEPCQPCTLHGRARCPRGHFRCMLGIEPAQVIGPLERLAAQREAPAPAFPGPEA